MSSDYTGLVEQAYQDLFGRESDTGGLASWTGNLESGAVTSDQLNDYMISSAGGDDLDYYNAHLGYTAPATSDYTGLVEQAYQDLFGRASDTGGLENWTGNLESGAITSDQLNDYMIGSAGGDDLDYYNTQFDYNTGLVEQAYQDLFGRESDTGGLENWTDYLMSGDITSDQLRDSMIGEAGRDDLNYYNNYYYMTPPASDPASTPAPLSDPASIPAPLSDPASTPAPLFDPAPVNEPLPTSASELESMFDYPLDLYQSSSNESEHSSYSGLPAEYQESLLQAIMPQLTQSIEDMPGNIDLYNEEAMKAYESDFKNMATKSMPGILNNVFGRNMQESSIAGDVTSNVLSDIVTNLQPQAHQTAMQSAKMKAEMPSLLASIAGLGSSNVSSGISSGESSDPGQPYNTALDFLKTMMY